MMELFVGGASLWVLGSGFYAHFLGSYANFCQLKRPRSDNSNVSFRLLVTLSKNVAFLRCVSSCVGRFLARLVC